MKRLLIATLAAVSLNGISIAQTVSSQNNATAAPTPAAGSATQASQEQTTLRIAPGSVIPVELSKSIDAKKIRSGDEVSAKVTQDLKTNNGEVLIPKDTKVVGHVTAVQPRTKEQSESELGIAFDHAVLKNGSEMKMPLSIQAIIAPMNADSGNTTGGAGGASDQAAAPSSPGGGMPTGGGRPAVMGGSPPAANMPSSSMDPADTQAPANARGPITGSTQGVVGISNLRLVTTAPDAAQGSLVSSEKSNVKLESGTLMLLRVSQ